MHIRLPLLLSSLTIMVGVTLSSISVDAASISIDPLGGTEFYGSLSDTGLGTADPVTVASQIVNVFLRLLGAITVMLMIYGGWTWIWARGNQEEVTKAKEIITGAVIGLVIVLASFGIMQYLFYYLTKITNAVK